MQVIDIMTMIERADPWPRPCTELGAMCAPADRTVKGGNRGLPRPSRIASAVLTELGIFAVSVIATVLDSGTPDAPRLRTVG